MSYDENCVSAHHGIGEGARQALPALRLCAGCYYGLRGAIKALPALHARLGDHLAPGGGGSGAGPVSGSPSRPLPINPAVAELRDQIRHDLVWWCVYVADERGLTLPADHIDDIGAWLGRHVDWIAGQAAAAVECLPVMRALAGRARAILEPSGAKRIKIGPCKEVLEDGPCGGTLYATVRQEDDPRPSVIYCGECGIEHGAETWRRFGREYQQEGRMVS